MFKMVAVMCILVNGVPECTTYEHNSKAVFPQQQMCEQVAEQQFYAMMEVFTKHNIPFETIALGCEKIID